MIRALRNQHRPSSLQFTLAALLGCFGIVLVISSSVQAMQFSSSNYLIDTATLNSVGGNSSSTNYQLTSSGGEAAIGNGASGSYRLAAGYAAQIITPAIVVKTQPSDLQGYYPLDENTGTVVHDTSLNAHLGSFVGAPTWLSGKISSALSFNGTDQAVNFNNTSQGSLTEGTIQLWVNSSASTGTKTLVAKQGSWLIGLNNGAPMLYNFVTSTTCTSATTVTDSSWHHIAVTLDDGVSNGSVMYVDGVQSQACTWSPQNQTGVVTFGASYNGSAYSQYYGGAIDQVKIFNRIMDANEIAAEFSAQNSGTETGLSLQTVVPGVSNQSDFSVITLTSGSSYTLAISQDGDLQSGAASINAVSGTIASPVTWNEGTTKGLGFTLTSTNATAIPGSWSSGQAYAALPNSATSFYTRSGQQPTGTKDVLGMQLRLDTPIDQPGGSYSNAMYITGVANL